MRKKKAAKTIDEYLANIDNEEHRAALAKLRKQISAAAPKAEECISYQMPAFRQNGTLVYFLGTPQSIAHFIPAAESSSNSQ